jgi:hypothetical protein
LAKDKLPARKCAECHEDPHHDRPGIPAKAMLLDDTADCARCHASTKWSDARVTPAKHAEFGFPLRGGHAKAECTKCHGDGQHASKHPGELPPLDACARKEHRGVRAIGMPGCDEMRGLHREPEAARCKLVNGKPDVQYPVDCLALAGGLTHEAQKGQRVAAFGPDGTVASYMLNVQARYPM